MSTCLLFTFVLLTFAVATNCLQVIPERTHVDYVNPKYASEVKTSVKRSHRRGPYIFNLEFTNIVTLGNNYSLHVIFHEFLNNEFKRSFIEMHLKLCNMIDSDPYMGQAVARAGIKKCPIPPGSYKLMNMSIPNAENFPYVWPFEKGKAVAYMTYDPLQEKIAEAHVVLTFKQTKKTIGVPKKP